MCVFICVTGKSQGQLQCFRIFLRTFLRNLFVVFEVEQYDFLSVLSTADEGSHTQKPPPHTHTQSTNEGPRTLIRSVMLQDLMTGIRNLTLTLTSPPYKVLCLI